jgi:aspartate carbamoyltransferase regulatory subunit
MEKHLKVSAIKDGTVIDHIPTKALFKVIKILKLEDCSQMVTFGNNLDSRAMGTKAIIKIANRFFADEEVNKIALVAPHAKLNIIRDYAVIEKKVVETPKEIRGIVHCFNPKCITNAENITTSFEVLSDKPITMKCFYCEKITSENEMIFF